MIAIKKGSMLYTMFAVRNNNESVFRTNERY